MRGFFCVDDCNVKSNDPPRRRIRAVRLRSMILPLTAGVLPGLLQAMAVFRASMGTFLSTAAILLPRLK